jgi:hypothetical protein
LKAYDGVSTSELDNLAAETAASMTIAHPDYAQLQLELHFKFTLNIQNHFQKR